MVCLIQAQSLVILDFYFGIYRCCILRMRRMTFFCRLFRFGIFFPLRGQSYLCGSFIGNFAQVDGFANLLAVQSPTVKGIAFACGNSCGYGVGAKVVICIFFGHVCNSFLGGFIQTVCISYGINMDITIQMPRNTIVETSCACVVAQAAPFGYIGGVEAVCRSTACAVKGKHIVQIAFECGRCTVCGGNICAVCNMTEGDVVYTLYTFVGIFIPCDCFFYAVFNNFCVTAEVRFTVYETSVNINGGVARCFGRIRCVFLPFGSQCCITG